MDKLNKRQIIILSLAALSVVFAAYIFIFDSPASKKVNTNDKNQETSSLASGSKNDLMKPAEEGIDKEIIARAAVNWKKNPFWDRGSSSYKEWASIQRAASASGSGAKIIYSGYVDAGKMKIAIINGLEYQVGEPLEMEGYVLKSATPLQVLILNKNTGSEVEIPLQE